MSILVFYLIEDLCWGCGGPGGGNGRYYGGIGDSGWEYNPLIVWGTGSSRSSSLFLVGTLGGLVSGGAAVQAKVVFSMSFLFNSG